MKQTSGVDTTGKPDASQIALALDALARLTPELLALTARLVEVNSHTANVAGVERVGELLCKALDGLPLRIARENSADFASHLCFSTLAAENQPALLLVGHHDTVFPAGSFEGFRHADELALGPGVLDMKGGLALCCIALRCLHEARLLEHLPVRFVSVSDEEVGSPSSQDWLSSLAQDARAALVFEAGRSGDAIVVARRGSGYARVVAHGRAAHAGNAVREGRNAIASLARFVDRVQSQALTLARGSISTGLFSGGSSRNTVPAHAVAELDLRFDDAEAQIQIESMLHEAARTTAVELEGVRLEVAVHITRRPLSSSAASQQLAERYGACQREAGLLSGIAPQQGGGSDANTIGALGIPVIDGLGPRGKGFHTHDEQIEVASLARKAEALIRFLLSSYP